MKGFDSKENPLLPVRTELRPVLHADRRLLSRCGGGEGNQSCAIARCSLEHGDVPFCWECPEYPCPRYKGFDEVDSFVPHRNRQQDIALVRELGLEAYLAQLEEKRSILRALLEEYNDGRRKTFFYHCGLSASP